MGSTFSITSPIEIKTNIGEVKIDSDIKSEIDPHIKMESNHIENTLIHSQTSILIISNEKNKIIDLPMVSKLMGYNYKIINKTKIECIIKASEKDTICSSKGVEKEYKLLPRQCVSLVSDDNSTWWIC